LGAGSAKKETLTVRSAGGTRRGPTRKLKGREQGGYDKKSRKSKPGDYPGKCKKNTRPEQKTHRVLTEKKNRKEKGGEKKVKKTGKTRRKDGRGEKKKSSRRWNVLVCSLPGNCIKGGTRSTSFA